MGNSCQRGYCSSWETRRRMAQMSERERISVIDDNSMGAGGVIFIYRVFLYLIIIGSLVTNLALQRDPQVGPDPAVARFNALPHVIWVVLPLIALAMAERARLFSPARSWADMIRRLGFSICLLFVALLGEAVHWIALLVEGVTCTSPLCISSTTYAFMWTLFGFVTVQFLLCLWLIGRLFVLRTNAWAYRDIMIKSRNLNDADDENPTVIVEEPSAPSLDEIERGREQARRMGRDDPVSPTLEEEDDQFNREPFVTTRAQLPWAIEAASSGIAKVGEVIWHATGKRRKNN